MIDNGIDKQALPPAGPRMGPAAVVVARAWLCLAGFGFCLGCSAAEEVRPCIRDCPSARAYDAQSYELRGRFDWSSQRLVATELISLLLTNRSSRVVELDSAVEVKRVRAGALELGYAADAVTNTLRVDLSPLDPASNPLEFTIDYEAPVSNALRATLARDGDPVDARVLYTYSEPFDGKDWLIANHRPADRATWAVELSVDSDEDVVANGARTLDEQRAGERVVRYQIDQPVPSYTMAFAAGRLEHRERSGPVPLSLWYRRGLLLDPDVILEQSADAMATFERLLGPYPWQSYALVLLPDFSGGMENTTASFDDEWTGQASPSFKLNAHELAHQWFGDWVTIESFDDLWIKEGMATLLQFEADRARRDAAGTGRLFGTNFSFNPPDSIRDRGLSGHAKYTSGPYKRAAWLLTQIRARVGEGAFWQALRGLLHGRALGSVGSEDFVRAFGLDEITTQQVLAALDEKRVPSVAVEAQPSGGDTALRLSLSDPGATLIAPIAIAVVDAAGGVAEQLLTVDQTLGVTVPKGGYLALDEADVHPDWWLSFSLTGQGVDALSPLLIPTAPAALAAFLARPSAQQERALGFHLPLDFAPSAWGDFYAALGSPAARRAAELAACATLRAQPDQDWAGVLGPTLGAPSILDFAPEMAGCGPDLPSRSFGAEFAALAANVDASSASRLLYLMSFDYGAASSLSTLAQIATHAPSLQLRELSLSRLSAQTDPNGHYSAIAGGELPAWRELFRARLEEATSALHVSVVWPAVVWLADDGALGIAGKKLHVPGLSDAFERQIVCDASALSAARPEAWTEFQRAAQPWDTLSESARAVLAIPDGCAR